MLRKMKIAAILVLVAALLSACGGTDEPSSGTPTTATDPTTEYLADINQQMLLIEGSIEYLGQLFLESDFDDDAWWDDVQFEAEFLQNSPARAEELAPPEEAEAIQKGYLRAADMLAEAGELIAQFVTTKDAGYVEEALPLIERAATQLDKVAAAIGQH